MLRYTWTSNPRQQWRLRGKSCRVIFQYFLDSISRLLASSCLPLSLSFLHTFSFTDTITIAVSLFLLTLGHCRFFLLSPLAVLLTVTFNCLVTSSIYYNSHLSFHRLIFFVHRLLRKGCPHFSFSLLPLHTSGHMKSIRPHIVSSTYTLLCKKGERPAYWSRNYMIARSVKSYFYVSSHDIDTVTQK